jgi:hypothetical protein
MTQFSHDDFAKDYLIELLSNIGTAIPNKVIKIELFRNPYRGDRDALGGFIYSNDDLIWYDDP